MDVVLRVAAALPLVMLLGVGLGMVAASLILWLADRAEARDLERRRLEAAEEEWVVPPPA